MSAGCVLPDNVRERIQRRLAEQTKKDKASSASAPAVGVASGFASPMSPGMVAVPMSPTPVMPPPLAAVAAAGAPLAAAAPAAPAPVAPVAPGPVATPPVS